MSIALTDLRLDRVLDTSLIQRAAQDSDPIESLRYSGLLCDDPLETFS
ncbi:hypothetical protein VAEKB19_2670001 [Vibrio aestuarianus]|nr:hypothetical protein VAEKB19_2670001 [Vibrio aestuarianus]